MTTTETPRPLPVPERQFPPQVYFEAPLDAERQISSTTEPARLPRPQHTSGASIYKKADPTPTTNDLPMIKRLVRPDYVSPVLPEVKRDDDDKSPSPSLPILATPATSDAPKPQKPGDSKATSTLNLSTNYPTLSLSTNYPYTVSTSGAQNVPTSAGNGSLSTGASIGIGVGVAFAAVFFLVAGFFFFLRRRASKRFIAAKTADDEEGARKTDSPEVWAHSVPPGVAEMVGEKPVSELASPVVPVEAVGDHSHPAELPGCEVPSSSAKTGGDERLSDDSPIEPDNRSEIEARLINRKGEKHASTRKSGYRGR